MSILSPEFLDFTIICSGNTDGSQVGVPWNKAHMSRWFHYFAARLRQEPSIDTMDISEYINVDAMVLLISFCEDVITAKGMLDQVEDPINLIRLINFLLLADSPRVDLVKDELIGITIKNINSIDDLDTILVIVKAKSEGEGITSHVYTRSDVYKSAVRNFNDITKKFDTTNIIHHIFNMWKSLSEIYSNPFGGQITDDRFMNIFIEKVLQLNIDVVDQLFWDIVKNYNQFVYYVLYDLGRKTLIILKPRISETMRTQTHSELDAIFNEKKEENLLSSTTNSLPLVNNLFSV